MVLLLEGDKPPCKSWLKKTRVVSAILLLCLLSWALYHAWPREVQTPLWSEESSFTTQESSRAWDLVTKALAESLPDGSGWKIKAREALDTFYGGKLTMTDMTPWFSVVDEEPRLQELLKEVIRAGGDFRDGERPQDRERSFYPVLSTLHVLGELTSLKAFHEHRFGDAYEIWKALAVLDGQWVYTARSVMSHRHAIGSMDRVFQLGRYFQEQNPGLFRDHALSTLLELPLAQDTFARAFVFEYLLAVSIENDFIEGITRHPKFSFWPASAKWAVRPFYSQALYRQTLNQLYGQYQLFMNPLWQHVEQLEKIDAEFARKFRGFRKYLTNPVGHTLLLLHHVPMGSVTRTYYQKWFEVLDLRDQMVMGSRTSAAEAASLRKTVYLGNRLRMKMNYQEPVASFQPLYDDLLDLAKRGKREAVEELLNMTLSAHVGYAENHARILKQLSEVVEDSTMATVLSKQDAEVIRVVLHNFCVAEGITSCDVDYFQKRHWRLYQLAKEHL